jgi:hypothetical protein
MNAKTRAPMKTPTKAQLQARVEYYETALNDLVLRLLDPSLVTTVDDSENIGKELETLIVNAPSLNPADAPVKTRGKRNEPPADASENLAGGEQLVEVELRVGDEAAE